MQRYRLIWLVLFSLFFVLMLNITLKYVSFESDVAFLQIKQTEVKSISLYIYIFYVHVITSIVTLLAGFTQFNSLITRRFPKIHVALGRIYVYTVLVVAAPSGIYIGWYANGGITSKIAFISLGILWWLFTLIGVLKIKRKNLILHSKWMHRSFALACSAITLRLWKVILVYLLQPSPMELYQIIAWLGWIPNLLLIEYYLTKKIKP
jgi:hypothetical protein